MLDGMIARLAKLRAVRRSVDASFVHWAKWRTAAVERECPVKLQHETLQRLVKRAARTRFGADHHFDSIADVAAYQERVPLRDYEGFWHDYWQGSYPDLSRVTCPDPIRYVALSSGTTSGSTKHIPVSNAMLASNRRAALTSLARLATADPTIQLFSGQMFFLGGSTSLQSAGAMRNGQRAPLMGDLSGIVAKEVSPLARPFTFPPLDLALIEDWDEKLDRMARASIARPITLVSGVPSWLLVLFERVLTLSGKSTIAEVWPSLRVVVHGGTRFEPYQSLFREAIGSDRVHLLETYPASEGFIAAQDPSSGLLRLIVDHDVFFEFVPVDELDSPRPTRHTVADLEVGVPYAVVLTTCAGLWSYLLGDTVIFECRDRFLLRFAGRTKQYLSAFGEHLIVEEIERALTQACESTGASIREFHAGPMFPKGPSEIGYHRYYIEFAREPLSLESFTRRLDMELSKRNEDYRAHRAGDLTIAPPEVIALPKGAFADWMRSRGKLGGQHKVLRLDNTGRIGESLEDWARVGHHHDLSRVC